MDAAVSATPERMQIGLRWRQEVELPLPLVNVFALQLTPDGIVMNMGSVAPPVFLGTTEEQQVSLRDMGELAVTPVFRCAIPVQRARELLDALLTTLETAGAIEVDEASPS